MEKEEERRRTMEKRIRRNFKPGHDIVLYEARTSNLKILKRKYIRILEGKWLTQCFASRTTRLLVYDTRMSVTQERRSEKQSYYLVPQINPLHQIERYFLSSARAASSAASFGMCPG